MLNGSVGVPANMSPLKPLTGRSKEASQQKSALLGEGVGRESAIEATDRVPAAASGSCKRPMAARRGVLPGAKTRSHVIYLSYCQACSGQCF